MIPSRRSFYGKLICDKLMNLTAFLASCWFYILKHFLWYFWFFFLNINCLIEGVLRATLKFNSLCKCITVPSVYFKSFFCPILTNYSKKFHVQCGWFLHYWFCHIENSRFKNVNYIFKSTQCKWIYQSIRLKLVQFLLQSSTNNWVSVNKVTYERKRRQSMNWEEKQICVCKQNRIVTCKSGKPSQSVRKVYNNWKECNSNINRKRFREINFYLLFHLKKNCCCWLVSVDFSSCFGAYRRQSVCEMKYKNKLMCTIVHCAEVNMPIGYCITFFCFLYVWNVLHMRSMFINDSVFI